MSSVINVTVKYYLVTFLTYKKNMCWICSQHPLHFLRLVLKTGRSGFQGLIF